MQFSSKFQDNSPQALKEQNLLHRENQKPSIDKTVLYNKGTSGGITITDIMLYHTTAVMKTAWYWHKNRQEDQWN